MNGAAGATREKGRRSGTRGASRDSASEFAAVAFGEFFLKHRSIRRGIELAVSSGTGGHEIAGAVIRLLEQAPRGHRWYAEVGCHLRQSTLQTFSRTVHGRDAHARHCAAGVRHRRWTGRRLQLSAAASVPMSVTRAACGRMIPDERTDANGMTLLSDVAEGRCGVLPATAFRCGLRRRSTANKCRFTRGPPGAEFPCQIAGLMLVAGCGRGRRT